MPITFGRRDLLEYVPKHSVLICRECKYAVQNSALGSHLLRHKIYREERQRLLSSIARHRLLEPDEVPLPPAGSPPVDGLPVISGFRCTASGCVRLCASSKRMRRHWSESHDVSDPPDSFASSVNIQTFFRGTKLRYFEVGSPLAAAGRPPVTDGGSLTQQHDLTPDTTPAFHAQMTVPPSSTSGLDMETLRYFHHFTTTTSLTLPTENKETGKYWQVDVVAQALRLRWLMYGLLSISASHMAALSDDEMSKQLHRERSARFLEEFSIGWAEIKDGSGVAETEEARVGAQMICVQRCCHWTLELTPLSQETMTEPGPLGLRSFMTTLQGCVDPSFALRYAYSTNDTAEETLVRTKDDSGGSPVPAIPGNAPPTLVELFRSLPQRMAGPLGKPDSVLDFVSTLSAIDELVECCLLSYSSDDMASAWMGMELWLQRLSDHFNQMVWRRSPAAIIVLAHWLLLVERVERYCWYLRGLATKVLFQIREQLPADNALQSLVLNLLS
jgi:hypothetical protein